MIWLWEEYPQGVTHISDPEGEGWPGVYQAARKVQVGDIIIIMSYAMMDFEEAKSFKPSVVFPDSTTNRLVK